MNEYGEAAKEAGKEIQDEIRAALEQSGITYDFLVDRLKQELDADETKFFQFQGIVEDERAVPDWPTRQRARMDAHKLRGDYPAEKHHQTGDITVTVVSFAKRKKGKK